MSSAQDPPTPLPSYFYNGLQNPTDPSCLPPAMGLPPPHLARLDPGINWHVCETLSSLVYSNISFSVRPIMNILFNYNPTASFSHSPTVKASPLSHPLPPLLFV